MNDIREQIEWLHEAKRGLGYPTQAQYNELWRTTEKMLTALEDIAKQELIIEMDHEGDIEYGYDAIIEVARAAVLGRRTHE